MRRQIVFSTNDIGSYKVDCVKRAILARSPTAHVHLYKQSFQSVDKQQLRSVQVIFGCTDNLEAREAINQFALTHSIVYIDGGSSGFGGQAQLVLPGITPCFHCLACLFSTESQQIPLCTIRSRPTRPEHCILYASTVLWENAFHSPCNIHDESACQWIYEKALERSREYSVDDVTLETTKVDLLDHLECSLFCKTRSLPYLLRTRLSLRLWFSFLMN